MLVKIMGKAAAYWCLKCSLLHSANNLFFLLLQNKTIIKFNVRC